MKTQGSLQSCSIITNHRKGLQDTFQYMILTLRTQRTQESTVSQVDPRRSLTSCRVMTELNPTAWPQKRSCVGGCSGACANSAAAAVARPQRSHLLPSSWLSTGRESHVFAAVDITTLLVYNV